jgi:hypothetical protein
MVLTNLILAAILVLMFGAVVFGLARVFQAYLCYRGQRVVTGPETQQPAAVHVNAVKSAQVAMAGKAELRAGVF